MTFLLEIKTKSSVDTFSSVLKAFRAPSIIHFSCGWLRIATLLLKLRILQIRIFPEKSCGFSYFKRLILFCLRSIIRTDEQSILLSILRCKWQPVWPRLLLLSRLFRQCLCILCCRSFASLTGNPPHPCWYYSRSSGHIVLCQCHQQPYSSYSQWLISRNWRFVNASLDRR